MIRHIHNVIPLMFILSTTSCLLSCAELTTEDQTDAQDKIINGQDESGHPYVVSLISNEGRSVCTGSVIAPQVVLTAAHCILSDYGLHPPALIEVGSFVGDPSNSRIPVSSYLIRDDWEMRTGGFNYDFDIALLYLSQPVNVRPVAYSSVSPAQVVNQTILAVGYGVNNGFQQSGSGVKRSVNLTITETQDFHFIATWLNGAPLDTCQGDSGGPALYQGASGFEVLGVVSNGPTYCQGSTQYTSVSSHSYWITANLSGQGATQQDVSSGPEASRYTTCSEVINCIETCVQSGRGDSSSCENQCYYEGSSTAQGHYVELGNCRELSGCPQGDNVCYSERCSEQMTLCGLSLTQGPPALSEPPLTSCVELRECYGACYVMFPSEEQYLQRGECSQRCYERVSDTTIISQDNNLSSCLARLRPTCDDDECVERECRDEILACGYPLSDNPEPSPEPSPAPDPAEYSCSRIYACMATCTDESCINDCYGNGSSQGQMALDALWTCYQGNSCDSFYNFECMSNECPDEFLQCR